MAAPKPPGATLVLAGLLAACHPRLPLRVVHEHPPLVLATGKVARLDASEPTPPRWLSGAAKVGPPMLVGAGSGASLEEARASAKHDLERALSRFLAVEVSAESEAVETHEDAGGKVVEAQDLHAESHARAELAPAPIEPSAEYWESLSGAGPSFRVYLRAEPSKAELDRARVAREVARIRAAGRRVVLVLAAGDGPDDRAIHEAISRHVAAEPLLGAPDPGLVRRASLDLDGARELDPDLIVGIEVWRRQGSLGATLALRDRTAVPLFVRPVKGGARDRFELEAKVWSELEGELRPRAARREVRP